VKALEMVRWMVCRKVLELDVQRVPESAQELVLRKVQARVVAKDGKTVRW